MATGTVWRSFFRRLGQFGAYAFWRVGHFGDVTFRRHQIWRRYNFGELNDLATVTFGVMDILAHGAAHILARAALDLRGVGTKFLLF